MARQTIVVLLAIAYLSSSTVCLAYQNQVTSDASVPAAQKQNKTKDLSQQTVKKSFNQSNQQQTTEVEASQSDGRSMTQQSATGAASQSSPSQAGPTPKAGRGGRMLDLDHLAGDIDKNESLTRGRSVSGSRQSRILNEDISLNNQQQLPTGSASNVANSDLPAARSQQQLSSKKKKKKLSIQGFIPIVSMNGGSQGMNIDDSADEADDNEQNQSNLSQADQFAAVNNYGAKTSLGHASFELQHPQPNSESTDEAGRARKLGKGLFSQESGFSATTPARQLMNNLFTSQSNIRPQHHHMQAPSNNPLMLQHQNQLDQHPGDCICVPFFQCKTGFLSESQLSKSQLQQIIYQDRNFASTNGQTPRALQASSSPSQQMQLQHQNQNQQQQLVADNLGQNFAMQVAAANNAPITSTSPVDNNNLQQQQQQYNTAAGQQQLNDAIYEQIRKTIESNNLENLSQQQLIQLQQQEGFSQADLNQYLEERSRQASATNGTTSQTGDKQTVDDNLEARGILGSTLARRSSNACGVLRTCCKLPPHLIQSALAGMHQQQFLQQQQQQQFLQNRPTNGPYGIPSTSQLPMPVRQPQPDYPSMVPSNDQPSIALGYQQQQPQHHINHQHQHQNQHQQNYLHQHSGINQHQPKLINNINNPQRGNFMEGRCGVRLSSGINGRVQNLPVGDNIAEFGEFPAQVAILKRIGSGESLFVCSAVLISNLWIATAAHCVRRHASHELKVRLGEWDVQRDDEFYPFVERNIAEIIIHPEFQQTSLANDIALLKMDLSLMANTGNQDLNGQLAPQDNQFPHIAPACLPRPNENFDNQRCWVAGWGKDAFGQRGAFQSVLKKVDLPVLNRHTCEHALRSTKLGPHFRLHQSAICAGGEPGKDACEGDGGSGLYCVDGTSGIIKVVGLVSWGLSCGQAGVPGVYTNTKHLSPWIESVVANSGEENLYNSLAGIDLTGLISERSKNATIPAATSGETMGRSASNSTIVSANSPK